MPPPPPTSFSNRTGSEEAKSCRENVYWSGRYSNSDSSSTIRRHCYSRATNLGLAEHSILFPSREAWKPKFLLDGKPLPASTCVWVWEKSEGGHITQTLAQGLILPEDVHAFEEGSEESIGRKLQWHTITVTLHLPILY